MLSQKLSKPPSLLRVLVQTFWPEYLYLGILVSTLDLVIKMIAPIMLGLLLDYFKTDTATTKSDAFTYAGVLVILNAVSAILINQIIMDAFHYGMRVRAACCSLIYRKVS